MKIEIVGKDVVTATEELLTIQGLEGSFSVGWVKERNPTITNQVMDNAKIFSALLTVLKCWVSCCQPNLQIGDRTDDLHEWI